MTAEEHLDRLKTILEHIGLQMQNQAYREKEVENGLDQCVKVCDIVRKKFADEKKILDDHIQDLKDELLTHQSQGN